jgi:hypothetical protein
VWRVRNLADSDLRGHSELLSSLHRPGETYVERQCDVALAHASHPTREHPGVETQVADDAWGMQALVPHRLHRHVVVDRLVALRVAGDPDLRERPPHVGEYGEHGKGRVVRPDGRVGFPGGHEDVVDADGQQSIDDVLEMRRAGDQTCGHMRDNPVSGARQPFGELQRRLEPLGR